LLYQLYHYTKTVIDKNACSMYIKLTDYCKVAEQFNILKMIFSQTTKVDLPGRVFFVVFLCRFTCY